MNINLRIGNNKHGDFMSFIGVFTETRKEIELKHVIKNYFESINQVHTVIIINQKNIDNMKNIKFEVVVLDANVLGNTLNVQKIITNAKVVVVNTDLSVNLKCIKNLKLRLITYGVNSKSTVSVSSINDDIILVSLQRSIRTLKDNIIEPQEVNIITQICHNNLYISMILVIFSIIFDKN